MDSRTSSSEPNTSFAANAPRLSHDVAGARSTTTAPDPIRPETSRVTNVVDGVSRPGDSGRRGGDGGGGSRFQHNHNHSRSAVSLGSNPAVWFTMTPPSPRTPPSPSSLQSQASSGNHDRCSSDVSDPSSSHHVAITATAAVSHATQQVANVPTGPQIAAEPHVDGPEGTTASQGAKRHVNTSRPSELRVAGQHQRTLSLGPVEVLPPRTAPMSPVPQAPAGLRRHARTGSSTPPPGTTTTISPPATSTSASASARRHRRTTSQQLTRSADATPSGSGVFQPHTSYKIRTPLLPHSLSTTTLDVEADPRIAKGLKGSPGSSPTKMDGKSDTTWSTWDRLRVAVLVASFILLVIYAQSDLFWGRTPTGRTRSIFGITHPDDEPSPWTARYHKQRNVIHARRADKATVPPSAQQWLRRGKPATPQQKQRRANQIDRQTIGVASPGLCPAPAVNRSRLVNTGRRALVVVTATHKHSHLTMREQAMEMDNLAFFMRHAVFPPGFETALFSQVDYVFGRVVLDRRAEASTSSVWSSASASSINATSKTTQQQTNPHQTNNVQNAGASDSQKRPQRHETRKKKSSTPLVDEDPWHCITPQSNIRVLSLPKTPCDLCVLKYAIESAGADRPDSDYEYVFSLNSGSRGPFFTAPRTETPPATYDAAKKKDATQKPSKWQYRRKSTPQPPPPPPPPPFTWIDSLALGGEDHYTASVLTGVSGSVVVQPHFMTHAFGFPMRAWSALDSRIDQVCDPTVTPGKRLCIFEGEVQLATAALAEGFAIRSLLHSQTTSFRDPELFGRALRITLNPLMHVDTLDPCQLMFVKSGGSMWSAGEYLKSTLDLLSTQTATQSGVTLRHPPFANAAAIMSELYGRCSRVDPPELDSSPESKRPMVLRYDTKRASRRGELLVGTSKEKDIGFNMKIDRWWVRQPWPRRRGVLPSPAPASPIPISPSPTTSESRVKVTNGSKVSTPTKATVSNPPKVMAQTAAPGGNGTVLKSATSLNGTVTSAVDPKKPPGTKVNSTSAAATPMKTTPIKVREQRPPQPLPSSPKPTTTGSSLASKSPAAPNQSAVNVTAAKGATMVPAVASAANAPAVMTKTPVPNATATNGTAQVGSTANSTEAGVNKR